MGGVKRETPGCGDLCQGYRVESQEVGGEIGLCEHFNVLSGLQVTVGGGDIL